MTRYRCLECGEVHDILVAAISCCAPHQNGDEVYQNAHTGETVQI